MKQVIQLILIMLVGIDVCDSAIFKFISVLIL